jgi:hypothetical protein
MTEFGNMTNLEFFSMNDNDLTGTIPTELGYLRNMTRMIFKDCFLSGTIPVQLGNMTRLENLSLESNLLTGTAPAEVCNLRNQQLAVFVTDCKHDKVGVDCPVDACCTFCRRGETILPAFLKKEEN